MQYIAFDAHKHYTLASVAQADGRLLREERIEHERGRSRSTPGGSGPSIARFGGSGANGSLGVREESRSPGASTRNFSPCIRSTGPISLVLGPVRGVMSEDECGNPARSGL